MNFNEKLRMYAKLLVSHGCNVQKGQDLYVSGELIHRDLINMVAEEGYARGARVVYIELTDPRTTKTRVEHSEDEHLDYVAPWITQKYDGMLPETAASIRILGSEEPDILEGLDTKKVNRLAMARKKALKNFYTHGVGHSKVQWTLGAAATPKWGQQVFPDLEPEEACAALWEEIFKICRVSPTCIEDWKMHNDKLKSHEAWLNDLGIETLHFTGPGTDLKVGLSQLARFKGGTSTSPRGLPFEPNLPTEECFSTPDWRKTEGHVRATRPFDVNGTMVRGIELTFKEGKIVDFKAEAGADVFAEYTASDEGASRLGEVALVGIDSPVYQSGKIFNEILFDENACCHIAVGFSYLFCIKDSENMSKEELDAIGRNDSVVHTDMMISSEEVDVTAKCYSGEEVQLIKEGKWVR